MAKIKKTSPKKKAPKGRRSVGPKLRLEPRVPGSVKYRKNRKKEALAARTSPAANTSPLTFQNVDFDSNNIISNDTPFLGPMARSSVARSSNDSPDFGKTLRPNVTGPDKIIFDGIYLPETISFNDKPDEVSSPDVSDTDCSYRAVRHKVNHLRSSAALQPTPSKSSPKKLQPNKKIYGKRVWIHKGKDWTVEENLRVVTAFQKYGLRDLGKIAEYVKTKNESQIKEFIKCRRRDLKTIRFVEEKLNDPKERKVAERSDYREWKKRQAREYRECKSNHFNTKLPEHIATWPNIRKWRRLAYEQMLKLSRAKDYSKIVLTSLLQKFYDEEEEPSDPQVINVKAIYKYLMDCFKDEIPSQMPPKESALFADLLKDLRLLTIVHDFSEERQFLEKYRGATQYRPFEVKDEFKKKIKKINEEKLHNPDAIKVPEEVYLNLSRHRKFVQSLNPLTIPVWMIQKEQEDLGKVS